jgi:hypothetical protein
MLNSSQGFDHITESEVFTMAIRIEGRTILKFLLEEKVSRVWTGFDLPRIGSSGGSCEYGNAPSGSLTT